MERPTYKGSEVKGGEGRGNREREGPPVITVCPGSRGAKIVTACHTHVLQELLLQRWRNFKFPHPLQKHHMPPARRRIL